MQKIVFLPLDERPCNYWFPQYLYRGSINLVVPPKDILGDKKREANVEKLIQFLKTECKDADALVISLDMLLYGGLLPSRIHQLEKEVVENRLNTLKELKKQNSKLKIDGFSLIMRCPKYSSDDEEPTYYADCGAEIHKLGACLHKKQLGIEDNEEEILRLKEKITKENLDDYLMRRNKNLALNQLVIDYRKEGIIDYLVIPQDDSALYGFTAMDQNLIRDKIVKVGLATEILMYPGADEVGLALISRRVLRQENKKPKVFLKYASENASSIIPPYEDRPMGETIKYHIMAAGGRVVNSYIEADVVLCLSAPCSNMKEAKFQNSHAIEYDCFRNIPEFIDFIKDAIIDNKPVILADNAYANGGDLFLLKCLDSEGLLDKLAACAGWNTNANTLGTALAQGFLYYLKGATKTHFDFLALRYLEDYGYCSKVRFDIMEILPKYGYNYFYIEEERGIIAEEVKKSLIAFKDKYMPSIAKNIVVKDVYMPWRRMFETGISAEWVK